MEEQDGSEEKGGGAFGANIKTGTVEKKPSWPSSIECGGNVAHARHLLLFAWLSFVFCLHIHQRGYLHRAARP